MARTTTPSSCAFGGARSATTCCAPRLSTRALGSACGLLGCRPPGCWSRSPPTWAPARVAVPPPRMTGQPRRRYPTETPRPGERNEPLEVLYGRNPLRRSDPYSLDDRFPPWRPARAAPGRARPPRLARGGGSRRPQSAQEVQEEVGQAEEEVPQEGEGPQRPARGRDPADDRLPARDADLRRWTLCPG